MYIDIGCILLTYICLHLVRCVCVCCCVYNVICNGIIYYFFSFSFFFSEKLLWKFYNFFVFLTRFIRFFRCICWAFFCYLFCLFYCSFVVVFQLVLLLILLLFVLLTARNGYYDCIITLLKRGLKGRMNYIIICWRYVSYSSQERSFSFYVDVDVDVILTNGLFAS